MLFSSMLFLWIFLPTVLVVNMLLGMIHFSSEDKRIKVKNIFLLIASQISAFNAWCYLYQLPGRYFDGTFGR